MYITHNFTLKHFFYKKKSMVVIFIHHGWWWVVTLKRKSNQPTTNKKLWKLFQFFFFRFVIYFSHNRSTARHNSDIIQGTQQIIYAQNLYYIFCIWLKSRRSWDAKSVACFEISVDFLSRKLTIIYETHFC